VLEHPNPESPTSGLYALQGITKPKLIQTIYISLVWFKLGLKPFPMASLA
jgi:hypothetical protein